MPFALALFFCIGLPAYSFGFNQTSIQSAVPSQAPQQTAADYFEVGTKLRMKGELEQAIEAYRKAIELNPEYENAYVELGQIYRSLGRNEDALAAFQHGLDNSPRGLTHDNALSGKVLLLMNIGRRREAMEEIDRELSSDPNSIHGLFLRSALRFEENRTDESIADLNQALTLTDNPIFRSMLYGAMGVEQKSLSKYPEAIESLKKSIELRPDNAVSHATLAIVYFYLSRYDEAIDSADRAVNSADFTDTPDFQMDTFNTLGACLIKLERWQDAEKALRFAIKLSPTGIQPHTNLAYVLATQRKYSEAELELRDMIKQGIADWTTYAFLGSLYLAAERYADSAQMFRQALKFRPEDPAFMSFLGYSLLQLNANSEEAMDLLKRAAKAAPSNAVIRNYLGMAYMKLGDLAQAEKELLQAIKYGPQFAPIFEHLGDLYLKMGRKADALTYWKSAQKLAIGEDLKARLQLKITGQ
jgi:tetratricopeptide (TPR) repeat protein